MESNDLKICCYIYIRRVKKRKEGKPQRFARAIRATIFTHPERLGKHGTRKKELGGKGHQRDRPLPGRIYICILSRLINTSPAPERRRPPSPGLSAIWLCRERV